MCLCHIPNSNVQWQKCIFLSYTQIVLERRCYNSTTVYYIYTHLYTRAYYIKQCIWQTTVWTQFICRGLTVRCVRYCNSFCFTFVAFSFDSFSFLFLLVFTSKQLLTPQWRQAFNRLRVLPHFCLIARFPGNTIHTMPAPLMHLWKAIYINMHVMPTNSMYKTCF